MHTATECFFVSLNSADATAYLNPDNPGYLSHVAFDFEMPLLLETGKKSIQVTAEVSQFACYNTLSVINSNNNSLSITSGGVTYADSITIGNHNSTSLVAWFNTASAFTAAGFTLSNDTLTQTLTITSSSGAQFTVNGATSTCNTILGFSRDQDATSSVGGVLTFPFPGILLGERQIFVHWVDCDTRNICSSKMSRCNLICAIPVDPLSPAVFFQGGDPFLVRAPCIERIELALTNSRGELLDFRGTDWNMVLRFSIARDIPRSHSSFADVIQRFHAI